MDKFYYNALDTMEKAGVNRDYLVGWAGGYLGNPEREEQRVTDAYEAGYKDGQDKKDDGYSSWT